MDRATLLKYDANVPRYTSYPTAAQFHAGITPEAYGGWLERMETREPVSLYLHVPFCDKLCWYCGCNTQVVRSAAAIDGYVQALTREIDMVAARLPGRLKVSWLHWGGGTPTSLRGPALRRIDAHLRRRFDVVDGAEIAVEIDPRVFDDGIVEALRDIGTTRTSFGVQDFDPEVQRAVNRIQPVDMTRRAVEKLRAIGVKDINLDLIYGLPRQTLATFLDTVEKAHALAPERFAVFGYAHVPWMKKHQRLIREDELPDASLRLDLLEAASARLVALGYQAIGIDHFARPDNELAVAAREGTLRRNFQGYTTDPAAVLVAFGASAIGRLPQGYAQNAPAAAVYLAALGEGRLPTARGVAFHGDDRLRGALIERLMCDFRVDLIQVAAAHGDSAAGFRAEMEALAPLVADRLVEINGPVVAVTEGGRPLVRVVAAAFDRYYSVERKAHARAL
ncbi:MAG: oxygen-independent coproporphyrinogen III oxidase [Proteobacteria bacterium]|nr:oxygen-independent coproporphyrinogen III oxidase [Pseudomonadota bacterium]